MGLGVSCVPDRGGEFVALASCEDVRPGLRHGVTAARSPLSPKRRGTGNNSTSLRTRSPPTGPSNKRRALIRSSRCAGRTGAAGLPPCGCEAPSPARVRASPSPMTAKSALGPLSRSIWPHRRLEPAIAGQTEPRDPGELALAFPHGQDLWPTKQIAQASLGSLSFGSLSAPACAGRKAGDVQNSQTRRKGDG